MLDNLKKIFFLVLDKCAYLITIEFLKVISALRFLPVFSWGYFRALIFVCILTGHFSILLLVCKPRLCLEEACELHCTRKNSVRPQGSNYSQSGTRFRRRPSLRADSDCWPSEEGGPRRLTLKGHLSRFTFYFFRVSFLCSKWWGCPTWARGQFGPCPGGITKTLPDPGRLLPLLLQ